MPILSFGDLAQSNLLRLQTAATKDRMARLSQDLATGRTHDTPRHLQGDLGPLSAIDASLARLQGYGAVTRDLSLFAGAMQSSLSHISALSVEAGNGLITASGTASLTHLRSAAGAAAAVLDTALATLNTRLGDRSLFSGTETASPALGSAEELLSALALEVQGMTDVASVSAALDQWFSAPGGFGSFYRGGAPLAPVPVAEGETVTLEVTAADPALRDSLKALATAALVARGVFDGTPGMIHDLARKAGEALLTTETARSHLAARLGTAEARIADATARNSAEDTALNLARSAMVALDPYETATRLQDAETQLQMIYTLTARLSRLSLADYL